MGENMKILILNAGPNKMGATNRITEIFTEQLSGHHTVNNICLGDNQINYCMGCKMCYTAGVCFQEDDVVAIVDAIYDSDAVVIVVPSYWAEMPGQMKVFVDRCTPYSNTNPQRKVIFQNTKGYAIALRTGPNPAECEGILKAINHYYGHMGIEEKGNTYLCGINSIVDIEKQRDGLVTLCEKWFNE